MQILLIEDEKVSAAATALMLTKLGFVVQTAELGEDGLKLAALGGHDVICLDLGLPDMHGYDVLKSLRATNIDTPILVLSGNGDLDSKVRCLGYGADDYVTKPFNHQELTVRLQAIARRSQSTTSQSVRIGELIIDLESKTAKVSGTRVPFTAKEFAILELLIRRRGSTIPKEMFLEHLYGGRDQPAIKIIDIFICKLRQKLTSACNGQDCIQTIWGRGYTLRVE